MSVGREKCAAEGVSMSKKSKKRVRKAVGAEAADPSAASARPLRRPSFVAAALAASVLLAASFAATRFEPIRRAIGMRPLSTTVAQATPTPPSKEYIYAGGRLVATEEPTSAATPTPTPGGPPPTGLVATASLPTQITVEVRLIWSAPSTATPSSYVVERASVRLSDGLKTDYAALGSPVTGAPTPSAPYFDPLPAEGMVYLYRVKAMYASGSSGYSNQDVAATKRYSGDDPLIGANDPLHRPASVVRAADLTELRAVVEAVRTLAGLGAGTWKGNPAPLTNGLILADHFTELRTNLNQALDELGIGQVPDDTSIASTQPVKAVHVQDVRDRLR
jgi:hypothetical protein